MPKRWRPMIVCAVLLAVASSCAPPRPPLRVSDADPSVKIPAMKKAVRERDASSVGQLVTDLDSDDAAVRFYAIESLRRLTGGDDFDYRYYDDELERRPALQRWQQWLAAQPEDTRAAP